MPAVGVTRSPQARARSSLSRKDSGVHRCLMDVSPPTSRHVIGSTGSDYEPIEAVMSPIMV